MIGSGFVARGAPRHRFIDLRIDRFSVCHSGLSLRFAHHAISQFALLPEQLLASVKVLVDRDMGSPQPQSCAGSGDLQQLVLMLARQVF